jgi:hypothetical protein
MIINDGHTILTSALNAPPLNGPLVDAPTVKTFFDAPAAMKPSYDNCQYQILHPADRAQHSAASSTVTENASACCD